MRSSKSIPSNSLDTDLLSCHPHLVESDLVASYQNKVLDVNQAQRMAEFFSLLGDGNRLRILSILAQQELCVCDLAAILNMTESAVSHQLRTLKVMRVVAYQKRGRKVYYRLLDHHILDLYHSVVEHLAETD
jgi:ArsR family transcriptional regulator, lead/cadmium/zinc/bismuth-responsive transcriptional repressor